MFTVGIFTTHLPYIAIVAFYAYFLLFGVEKASDGVLSSESFLTIEIDTDNFDVETCYHVVYGFTTKNNMLCNATFENDVFKRQIKHSGFIYSYYRQECSCYINNSRPPPLS